MIGNLISACAIALLSSVFVVGSVHADEIRSQTGTIALADSLVFENQKVYVPYVQFGSSIRVQNTAFSTNDGTRDYYGFDNYYSSVNTFDGTFEQLHYFPSESVAGIGTTLSTQGLPTNFTHVSSFYFSSLGETIDYNGQGYVIDGLECWFSFNFYDSNDNPVYPSVFNPTYRINGEEFTFTTEQNDMGLLANRYFGISFESFPLDFPVITIYSKVGASYNVSYYDVNCYGQWCCNYLTSSSYGQGYTAGLNYGYKQGYDKGYADATDIYSRGDFNSLFNALADTPLRFLYGLFSFDLFGTSMLVIILTLLTGIFVFGLVKKIWK